ncbi:MAG: (Fe-S)-binding protein [Bacteroidota bacterium]
MRVGLFVPCYVDQFYPTVAIATLELLEKGGCEVHYVKEQTCCGQPLANSGYESAARQAGELFANNFAGYDYVVAPSGSCTYHVRHHFDVLEQTTEVVQVRRTVYELSEFLTDVLHADFSHVRFPYRTGLHASCHGLRGLRTASSSELKVTPFNKLGSLLSTVRDLELVNLSRTDECCGFGGTFAVKEEAVSVSMGNDRLTDHRASGAEVITGADVSCLMHLEGLNKRQQLGLRIVHFAEILNGSCA